MTISSEEARLDLTKEAFEYLGQRLQRLAVKGLPHDELLIGVLGRVASTTALRRLSLEGNLETFWYKETIAVQTLRMFLSDCTSLDALHLYDHVRESEEIDDALRPLSHLRHDMWSLPSVRHLKLSAFGAPHFVSPEMAKTAPNAVRASFSFELPDFNHIDENAYVAQPNLVQWSQMRSFSLFRRQIHLSGSHFLPLRLPRSRPSSPRVRRFPPARRNTRHTHPAECPPGDLPRLA